VGERPARDDLGAPCAPTRAVRRVVSLVPSLTESIAVTAPGLLVGATDWCTRPADLDVARVRGTKNPDVSRIIALRPDLVLANEEENRAADIAALRAAGLAVWVTKVRDVLGGIDALRRVFVVCDVEPPAWLDEARSLWSAPAAGARHRAVVPIWRRPWMVLGRDTFAGDLLARLGVDNLYADDAERYPRVDIEDLRARFRRLLAEGGRGERGLVILPDEPYAFSASDGPESFPGHDIALVEGRLLTWYGPSLVEAHDVLTRRLAAAVSAHR
jgi:hypothetical protein